MNRACLSIFAAIPLAIVALCSAAAAAPRCDATPDGYRFQSRVACYRSCVHLRIRTYCNSWCDRYCRR